MRALPGDQDGLFLARVQTGLNPGDVATATFFATAVGVSFLVWKVI